MITVRSFGKYTCTSSFFAKVYISGRMHCDFNFKRVIHVITFCNRNCVNAFYSCIYNVQAFRISSNNIKKRESWHLKSFSGWTLRRNLPKIHRNPRGFHWIYQKNENYHAIWHAISRLFYIRGSCDVHHLSLSVVCKQGNSFLYICTIL